VLAEAEAAELGVSEGSYVKLTVADTGVGMDAATRARVFEPFFTTKEVGQGTGLGLSTVFGIVKQSGGAISVESAPGQGVSFHLHFPAVDDAPASVHPPVQRRDVQAGHERILLVEDDEALRAVIRRVLVARGYHVTDVCAPDMAIRYFRAHAREVDLVVTDMVMPETDGRVLVEQLRVEHPSLKVLFMSGYSEARVTDGGSIPLGDHFIQKPFTAQEIAAAVRRAIDHSTGAQS
jgi:CheY-like chemotaxis protein